MNDLPFAIIGSGGHAKVIIATLQACKKNIYAVFDENITKKSNFLLANINIQLFPPLEWWNVNPINAIIAIGSNKIRQKISQDLSQAKWESVIHPTAIVHESAIIGKGTYVGANAIIQPGAVIGGHTIINTGAIIEHDVVIGDYCHIAPGAIITGHVTINAGTLIGAGTTIIPTRTVGTWCTIGAGSVVVKDISNFKTAYGNPCKER